MADKVEHQENEPLEKLMNELDEEGMDILERLAIAKDLPNSAAESKPVDVRTKPEPAKVKKVRAQKKA